MISMIQLSLTEFLSSINYSQSCTLIHLPIRTSGIPPSILIWEGSGSNKLTEIASIHVCIFFSPPVSLIPRVWSSSVTSLPRLPRDEGWNRCVRNLQFSPTDYIFIFIINKINARHPQPTLVCALQSAFHLLIRRQRETDFLFSLKGVGLSRNSLH